jgi:hypothetical protein
MPWLSFLGNIRESLVFQRGLKVLLTQFTAADHKLGRTQRRFIVDREHILILIINSSWCL